MKHPTFLFTLTAAILAGCATAPTAEQIAARNAIAETIPTCSSEKECEVKWAAARAWINANAGWRLQHVQADYLETYNSVGGSTNIAVRVTKEPLRTGGYRILGSVWCDNMFGCYPDKWIALKHFNDYVNASWEPANR